MGALREWGQRRSRLKFWAVVDGLVLLVGLVVAVPRALATASAPTTIGIASSAKGGGWTARSDGSVVPFGGAPALGSVAPRRLAKPVVGIAATPDGLGYWLVSADGGVFAFGDAPFDGSAVGRRLVAPVVGMSATRDGHGYFLVGRDGGVFTFGDAHFAGSIARHTRAAIVGITAATRGPGYLITASDGGVYAFGGAVYRGSPSKTRLTAPVTAIAAGIVSPGYRLLARDGGIFAYGVPYLGRTSGSRLVGLATTRSGYLAADAAGQVARFSAVPASTPTPATTTPLPTSTPTTPVGEPGDETTFTRSEFARSTSGAPVLAQSAAYVAALVHQYQTSFGGVGVNGLPIFTVSASQPTVPVSARPGCGDGFVSQIGGGAPIPAGAYTTDPQYQHDSAIVISQPATHSVWELWEAANDGSGHWSACWGGRLDTATSDGVFPSPYGLSATGISYAATAITEHDVSTGSIDHAIAVQIDACNGFVAPADRGDCGADPGEPPEGTTFRMNPATPMPAGLTPFAQMVFRALQTYGAVVTDQAGGVEVLAESSRDWAYEGHAGTDPITASWAGQPSYAVLEGIPWGDLQAVAP